MAEERGSHDVWVALSESYPDTIQDLRDDFRPFLPPGRIVTWKAPAGTAELLPDSSGRRDAAERLRVAFLSSLRPDLIHVSSLFEGFGEDMVTGVPADTELPRAVYTLYDLIPFLQQDAYLPSEEGRRWYFRRLLQFRRAAGLLAISESSRGEAVEHLRFPGDRVYNVLAGVDPKFRPNGMTPDAERALLARYGLPEGFVFCVGAVEPRKNVDGLIRAYALLPPELRARHKLVATAWNDPIGLDKLRRVVAQSGLPQGDVLLLERFVREDDLPKLYEACALSVLPSFHEGFGLPAAEAMAAGAPVIGSRATSIPEVIGRDDALFDPGRPEDMAAKMEAVLTRPAFRAELVRDGLERARLFSWKETARRAWRALEAIHAAIGPRQEDARGRAVPVRKPRLSVVTPPLGGHLGGETTPRGSLLAGLTRHYDLELVHPGAEGVPGPAPLPRAPEHDDRVFYLPAGDPACTALMLDSLEGRPGVVALEGVPPLEPLLRDRSPAGEAALRRAFLDAHGWPALVMACRSGPEAAAKRYSGVSHVMGRAVGMLACSEAEAAVLRDERRRELPGNAGRRPVETVPACDWGAADAWRDAIESAYGQSPVAAMEACVAAAAAAARSSPCGGGGYLAEVAASLAETFDVDAGKRMLLDVTGISESDAGTGIQRVVKETARCLARRDDLGVRVELVRSTEGGLWSARAFGTRVLHLADGVREDVPQAIGRDDIYVGLDLRLHEAEMLVGEMRRAKLRGGKAVGVVYDLLPLQFPSHFPEAVRHFYPVWLRGLGRTADGLMCISRAVADQLCDWLEAERPARRTPLGVGFFHLGSDFLAAAPGGRPDPSAADVLAAMAARPTLLMVGTIEPRKGHAQALAAMDALWKQGVEVGLVIAGRAGWLVDELIRWVRAHPEFGRRLHWSEAPSDAVLPSLYRNAGALLMASEGEGFGLPIVEAARSGLAVIARDLPVFREIAGPHATYFSGSVSDAGPLAAAVLDWLDRRERGREPDAKLIRTLSWEESALEFADRVINEKWYRVWSPAQGAASAPGS